MEDENENIIDPLIRLCIEEEVKRQINVPGLKSLNTRMGKLAKRVDSLELMAFQDQISRLNDEIKAVKETLLTVSRVMAFSEMESIRLHLLAGINLKYARNEPMKAKLKEFVSSEFIKAKEKSLHNLEPVHVLADFRTLCADCSEKYDIGAFETKP